MPGVAGVDDVERPVFDRRIRGDIWLDVDVAEHIPLGGQIFLVDSHRHHDGDNITGDALRRFRADIHQNECIRVAGDNFDIGIGLLILDGDAVVRKDRQHHRAQYRKTHGEAAECGKNFSDLHVFHLLCPLKWSKWYLKAFRPEGRWYGPYTGAFPGRA